MAKKPRPLARRRLVPDSVAHDAMVRRILQRTEASGALKLPAVPALLEEYVALARGLCSAACRRLDDSEVPPLRARIAAELQRAYAGSQRSKLVLEFQAEAARPLDYAIRAEITNIANTYEKWVGSSDAPLFGAHADARVLDLASELGDAQACPVLDLGAGTGRNAFALARRGHPVDALEITPSFAEQLTHEARAQALPVRVITKDLFDAKPSLARNYRLFLASEVVPDFRSPGDLRRLFELASEVLADDGVFVLNLHLAAQGYTPEKAAREFAQQCYSALFTNSDVIAAAAGLPLELCANDSAYDYERTHLPSSAWPPTPWFENWALGLDVYELERAACPMELRWLVYRKRPLSGGEAALLGGAPRRFDPAALRKALVRRLKHRAVASGTLTFPALPSFSDSYAELCFAAFTALGREVGPLEDAEGRRLIRQALQEAFEASPRSNVTITYEAPMGPDVTYSASVDAVSIPELYARWLDEVPHALFGEHADARLLALLADGSVPPRARVLDIGAGTGRNALSLARLGYRVDAVELTPRFCEVLGAAAQAETLEIRIHQGDVFELAERLSGPYDLVLASGVLGDSRSAAELRSLLALAAARLCPAGRLLLSTHLAADGYEPTRLAREWGQQCSATFVTGAELTTALEGLPLKLLSSDSAYAFEQAHLPEEAWPPTPVYAEWALGEHMYALEGGQCPLELKWLLFEKSTLEG